MSSRRWGSNQRPTSTAGGINTSAATAVASQFCWRYMKADMNTRWANMKLTTPTSRQAADREIDRRMGSSPASARISLIQSQQLTGSPWLMK